MSGCEALCKREAQIQCLHSVPQLPFRKEARGPTLQYPRGTKKKEYKENQAKSHLTSLKLTQDALTYMCGN